MKKRAKSYDVAVTCRCVNCGAKRDIRAGEVPKGDIPMCEKCYSPMVAESAKAVWR